MKYDAYDFPARKTSFFQKAVLMALVPGFFLNTPVLLAQVTESPTPTTPAQSYPAPVTTPQNVKVNRTLPSFTPLSTGLSFSAQPTDQEIFSHSPFEEPLVPVGGKTNPTENAALAQALVTFSKRSVRDDYSSLENFLLAYPQSAWRVSLLTDLGWVYRQTGWYSKSLEAWEQAWALGKNETDPCSKAVVDRALSELVVLNARVGRIERLGPLFKEIQGRSLIGSAKEKIEAAKQGYHLMVTHPEAGYRCGPQALETLRQHWDKAIPYTDLIKNEPSSVRGTSLTQIYHLAQKMSLDLIMAKRTPGSAIPVPSVVNWKVGHFAAIIAQKDGVFHLHDPTFGNDVWISQTALDAESSGYFLIKNQALPSGWSAVDEAEGKTVWGKGPPNTADGNANMTGPQTCSASCGCMAVYSIYETLASLTVRDTPLFYQPAYGPKVEFTVSYSQRESNQPSTFAYSNLGPLWTFNWLSYITDEASYPGTNVSQYLPGGGTLTYVNYNSSTGTFDPLTETGAILKLTSSTSYELDMPDGSKQIFTAANSATPRKVFMTQSIDPKGNALTYSYDTNYRMTAVTDATGLVTTLTYGSTVSSNPAYYQITQVTDPFGRTASLTYTSDGSLASSTDMIGIASQYTYDSGAMQSLQTPYGITTFDVGQDTDKRWVQATDPQGGQERVETWASPTANPTTPDSITGAVPAGITNSYLSYRNAYYWDKKEMLVGAGDYTKAKITHFLHVGTTSTMSDQVESIQEPLESRVYYNYLGQAGSIYTGTNAFPTRIARILANGHTQETDITNSSIGKITQVKRQAVGSGSPVVREITNYTYATNGIDLTQVSQVNGASNDILFAATYNSQHEPLTTVDASGQTTTYTYYSNGQIETVVNAKGETTTYGYNSSHQLTSITDSTTGGAITATYDSYGRIRTITDLNGYTKTYDYDALNRVTKITYPDSSYDQYVYTNLDVTLHKDRQNRWTRYLYNSLQQLTGVVDPQGRVTTYERCKCGALKGLVDSKGHRTSWDQDLEGRTISKTYPDGSAYAYTYDVGYTSRLLSVTDPKSQVTNYTYNDDDSPSQIAYADSTVALTYDSAYLRLTGATSTITATSASYATAFTYNPVYTSGTLITGGGRVATETGPLGSTSAITYSYDALGRVTGTSINSVASGVTFDSLGRVTGAGNPLGNFTYAYYSATPRLHTVSNDQNGLNTSYSYQATGQDYRLTDISNYSAGTTVLSKFDYTYNAVGTLASAEEQTDSNTPTIWNYGYDNADQLTSATRLNTSTEAVISQYVYGYDLAGNRTSEQIGLSVTQTGVNNLNQITGSSAGGPLQFSGTLSKPSQVTVAGNTATYGNYYSTNFSGMANVTTGTNDVPVIAHDVNGNTSTNNYQVVVPAGTGVTPTYDGDGNQTYNGNGQTYTWDAENELTAITYTGGATSSFTYDALGRRLSIIEKNSGGSVTSTKQFVWVGTNIAEERDASNAVTKRFFAQGEQISGSNYYYTRDHLGSIREMVSYSGTTPTIQARYDYDPYGRATPVGTVLTPSDFQYAGYYEHAPSGLNLTLFRAYDPNTAKWLSRDPMGERVGINLYNFTLNTPINATDPLGNTALAIGLVIAIAALLIGFSIYEVASSLQQNQANQSAPPAPPQPASNSIQDIYNFNQNQTQAYQNNVNASQQSIQNLEEYDAEEAAELDSLFFGELPEDIPGLTPMQVLQLNALMQTDEDTYNYLMLQELQKKCQ